MLFALSTTFRTLPNRVKNNDRDESGPCVHSRVCICLVIFGLIVTVHNITPPPIHLPNPCVGHVLHFVQFTRVPCPPIVTRGFMCAHGSEFGFGLRVPRTTVENGGCLFLVRCHLQHIFLASFDPHLHV